MTLEAGTPIGKYVVKHKLAEGGMAEIYLATATGPEGFEKEVVIKRVRSFLADDEGFVGMFIAEARLASRLNHANVVQIFDFDKHEDSYYLAMEYVRGCSLWELRKRCREKGVSMPPVLVAHIGAQVAAGLHYAHRLKGADGAPLHLVHRDVTPHNVLLSFDGAVKLTDFGIAKAGNKLTQPGMLKGKFAYMSPEQSRGEELDARTDTFALGVVLWEMLTGGRLFDGDSELAVLRAVQESVIAPPARLNPDVPAELDEVVSMALARNPEERFQTAGEMERALAQCVLRQARSVDDTDVGAFLRHVYGVPYTQVLPAVAERSTRSRSGSHPARTGESPSGADVGSDKPVVASPLEATAVQPGTTSSSGSDASSRAPSPEESLVSASTQVLPSRSTLPLPAPPSAPDARPTSAASPAGEESAPRPAVPVREAQVVPTVTSSREAAGTKRLGPGALAGVAVAVLLALGGVAFLVRPAEAPAPSTTAQVLPAPGAGDTSAPRTDTGAQVSPEPAAVEAPMEAPAEGVVAAMAPASEPESPESSAGSSDAGTAVEAPPVEAAREERPRAVKAKGKLVVFATPYATVFLNGRKLGEVQGRASYSLPAGSYRLTFKHPSLPEGESRDVTLPPDGTVTQRFQVRRR